MIRAASAHRGAATSISIGTRNAVAGSVVFAMRTLPRRLAWCALVVACAKGSAPVAHDRSPAVVLVSSPKTVSVIDSVSFVAHVRPDIAAQFRPSDHLGDGGLHSAVIGWHWYPDLDIVDPWTKACDGRDSTCTIMVHGAGTMTFTVKLGNVVCADWVHLEPRSLPDIDEVDDSTLAPRRLREDSIRATIKTKSPYWQRCTA
jgi:hypothetical protein